MELVKQIKEAEVQARGYAETAKDEIQDRIDDVKREFEQTISQARKERLKALEEVSQTAQQQAEVEAGQIIDENCQKCEALKSELNQKIDSASQKVLEYIWTLC